MERLRFKNENGKDYPEWESNILGRLCNISTGRYKNSTDTGEYIIMDMGSVSTEGRILDHKVTNDATDILEKGSLIMPKDDIGGGNIICKTAYIPTANKYVLGDHVYKLTSSVCNTRFLSYRINSVKTNRSLRRKVTGSAQLGINAKNISNEVIRIPVVIQEQQKIGEFLSAIDKLVDKQREKVELLKEMKKGYLQKVFNQGLRFKDENGNNYPSWKSVKMKDITKVNQGLQIPISKRERLKTNTNHFYITIQFLKQGLDEAYYISSPPKSVICTKEDILMTRTGNTGMVVTGVEGVFHNNFFKVNYDKNRVDRKFLIQFLNSDLTQFKIKSYAGTTTIPDISHGDFYFLDIPLPDMQEQIKIGMFIETLTIRIESSEKRVQQLIKIKDGYMQRLFA